MPKIDRPSPRLGAEQLRLPEPVGAVARNDRNDLPNATVALRDGLNASRSGELTPAASLCRGSVPQCSTLCRAFDGGVCN
jgi:hypothetical protein